VPGALPAATVGAFSDGFPIVAGVLLSLAGLSLVLMGVLGMANRRWRRGAAGTAAGVLLVVAGFLLVGVIG
jgi:hypothetical protein